MESKANLGKHWAKLNPKAAKMKREAKKDLREAA
jgi:hypothetical protein